MKKASSGQKESEDGADAAAGDFSTSEIPSFEPSFVPVRTKVAVMLSILAVIMIALSGIFVYRNYQIEANERTDKRAIFINQMIEGSARTAGSDAEFRTMIEALQDASFVSLIAVLNKQGHIIASSNHAIEGQKKESVPELAAVSADKLRAPKLIRLPSDQKGSQDYLQPMGDGVKNTLFGGALPDAVVFVRIDTLTPPTTLQAKTWSFLAWLAGGIICCAVVISLALQRMLVAPIEGLRRFAEKGDKAALVPAVGPPDEISKVSQLLVQSYYAHSENEAKLADFAMTDGLTGLGNRVLFKGRLSRELIEAENAGSLVGVIVLNIDNFKDLNGTLGHDAGDYILQRTAENLKACLRKGDTVARLGADEFGIVLAKITDPQEAEDFAQRVLRAVASPIRVGLQDVYKSACAGVTLFPQDGRDPDILIKNADLALTDAKQEGAGSCTMYRHELRLRVMQRSSIERDLRLALARKQFVLFYQPKFDIGSGKLVGMEALIRWMHPERGLVSPETFISIAERTGVISEMTCWVLDEACRQVRAWHEEGLNCVPVAVNVSAIDLRRTDLADMVATTLLRHSVAPQYLELEVTESMVMHNVDEVIATLRRLRSLGVSIGIDDFGTGYSSLAYLRRFPVRRLKIDRSFIQDIIEPRNGVIIPKVIIDLAHALNIGVIAEGVETPEQLEILRSLGCDEAQGFLLGHPVPAVEFAALMSDPKTVVKQPSAGSAA